MSRGSATATGAGRSQVIDIAVVISPDLIFASRAGEVLQERGYTATSACAEPAGRRSRQALNMSAPNMSAPLPSSARAQPAAECTRD
jgi:hypothetical protein